MKILVFGFYEKSNIGDESYKETFVRLFPQHQLTFTNRLSPNLVEACDLIILGGGNVLRKGFLDELQKIKNKPIYGFSLGIEEPPTHDLSFFKHIYARDSRTIAFLQSKNIPCTFIPDAALSLEGDAIAGLNWIKQRFKAGGNELYSKIITVVINSYMLHGSLSDLGRDAFNFLKFSYDMARVVDEIPASFIFIPFGTQIPFDDRTANAWVATKCKYWKKNYVCFDELNTTQALNIIAASDVTISSRLHSSIFSFTCGTPLIDITHHSKNDLFLEMIGNKHNQVSFWRFDNELLKQKINENLHLPKHQECHKFKKMILETVNEIRFD